MNLSILYPLIERHGLTCRGAFHAQADDAVPMLSNASAAKTVVLVGNIGDAMWLKFSASPEYEDGQPDPLDRWSQRILTLLCSDFVEFSQAEPLYPFAGPPYLPFQKWAKRAEPVFPSPIGPLIHPEYGMWHAYRGALAFEQILELPERVEATSPCSNCADKPCLSTCPVDAFDGQSYDVPSCAGYLNNHPSGEDCLTHGCLARRACPIGRKYIYPFAQSEFHTSAFLRSQNSKNS